MLSKKAYEPSLMPEDNWCCNVQYNQQHQIVGLRKHIIPKSSQKNQKTQKTSLKKRSDSNKTEKQTKKQPPNAEAKNQCTPPKHFINNRNVRPPEPGVLFQQIQINSTPVPTANHIKYAIQKPHTIAKKINFIYNNKVTPVKFENLGVNDLESFRQEVKITKFQKTQSKTFNTTHAESAHRSFSPIDPYKSTQVTNRASDKVQSWDQSPGLSRDFHIDLMKTQVNNNKQEKTLLGSLSSRKRTVLSVSGDSESQESFAVEDMSLFPYINFKSLKSHQVVDQRQKFTHSSLKSSINF